MFGNSPSPNDRDENEDETKDPFAVDPVDGPSFNEDPVGGFSDDKQRFPWEELAEETAEELEEKSETPMCEHDEDREVITKQSGAGINLAGMGGSATGTVSKVVCPTCGGEWDTWDGSQQSSGQNPFGF